MDLIAQRHLKSNNPTWTDAQLLTGHIFPKSLFLLQWSQWSPPAALVRPGPAGRHLTIVRLYSVKPSTHHVSLDMKTTLSLFLIALTAMGCGATSENASETPLADTTQADTPPQVCVAPAGGHHLRGRAQHRPMDHSTNPGPPGTPWHHHLVAL